MAVVNMIRILNRLTGLMIIGGMVAILATLIKMDVFINLKIKGGIMAELELIVRENLDVAKLFTDPEGIDRILNDIKAKVSGIVPDVSTAKGRKEIAGLAFKVAQSKVLLVKMGKDLTTDWRVKTQKVNVDCNRIDTFLTNLKDEVRGPLTEWEKAEEERIKAETEATKYAADWDEAHKEHELFQRMKELECKEAELEAMKAAQKAEADRIEAERIARAKAEHDAEEARQAEIARKQQEEIDEANRLAKEKCIAEEAAAKAIKAAEEKAEAERKAAEQRLIDAEAKRIADLAAAQAKAEAEKKAVADAQEKARIEAEKKRLADIQAEKDRAEKEKQAIIEAQAKKDRETAEALEIEQARISVIQSRIQQITDLYVTPNMSAVDIAKLIDKAELLYSGFYFQEFQEQAKKTYQNATILLAKMQNDRLADEKAKIQKAEEEKRQNNVAHQKKINNEALNSLVGMDIDLADAKRIVEAIIKGQIANVFIKY